MFSLYMIVINCVCFVCFRHFEMRDYQTMLYVIYESLHQDIYKVMLTFILLLWKEPVQSKNTAVL